MKTLWGIFLLGVCAFSARGTIITFDDLDAFEAATDTQVVEDFEGWSSGGHGVTDLNGIHFTGSLYVCAPSCGNFGMGATQSKVLTSNGDENFTLSFMEPVYQLGLDTYINAYGDGYLAVYDSLGDFVATYTISHDYREVGFFGLISDIGISAVNWTSTAGGSVNTGIDNIRLASGSVSVNEPQSWLMMCFAFAGLAWTRKKPMR